LRDKGHETQHQHEYQHLRDKVRCRQFFLHHLPPVVVSVMTAHASSAMTQLFPASPGGFSTAIAAVVTTLDDCARCWRRPTSLYTPDCEDSSLTARPRTSPPPGTSAQTGSPLSARARTHG